MSPIGRLALVPALVFVAALLGGSPLGWSPSRAAAQGTLEWPESWFGVWEFSGIERDCTTQDSVGASPAEPDTICSGESFNFEEEGFTLDCTGDITDETINASCTGTFEVFTGCTATFTVTAGGTRSGDTVNGTQRVEITYTGDCGPLMDSCTDETFMGTRTADASACPPSPVAPVSWGALKTRYP